MDGVAGFGIPKLGAHGEALPMPLLWALTDPENVESNSGTLQRRFMVQLLFVCVCVCMCVTAKTTAE